MADCFLENPPIFNREIPSTQSGFHFPACHVSLLEFVPQVVLNLAWFDSHLDLGFYQSPLITQSPFQRGDTSNVPTPKPLHSGSLTCPQKKGDDFSREYIFQPSIFRGHDSFQGSSSAVCFGSGLPKTFQEKKTGIFWWKLKKPTIL